MKRKVKRREFLKTIGLGAASLALPGAPGRAGGPAGGLADPNALFLRRGAPSPPQAASGGGPDKKTPNLLIIHTDQQNCWTLGAYGGTLIMTPNIDSIAGEGARFGNFFTNSGVCTPSRGCFLTGRYPHAHGAYKNNVPMNRDEITLAAVLAAKGYDTGYAGKWHLDGRPKPGWVRPKRSMGFADCRFMFNRGHWKKIIEKQGDAHPEVAPYGKIGDAKTYTTDWLAEKTVAFIKKPRKKPFFFMVSIPDPHPPYTVRSPFDERFAQKDMPVPKTFFEMGGPAWLKKARGGKKASAKQRERTLRQRKAKYCGEVKCIDAAVGRILAGLGEAGLMEDTIVVYSTDHGDYMGEHGLYGKNNLYETAYRIPLIIRWPRRIRPGMVIDRFFCSVDFKPTILSLMGIAPSGKEQGRDGARLLTGGEKGDWTDEVFIHHSSLERAGIFTPRYELAYVKDSDGILFDRAADPDQTRNLFDDPAHAKAKAELAKRIVEHNRAVEAPAAAWLEKIAGEKPHKETGKKA